MADHMTAEQMSGALLKAADDISRIDVAEVDLPDVIEIESVIRSVAARLSGMEAVPDGWKLVPATPTDVMLLAADSELMREPRIGMVRGRSPARVYAAMLATAPEPPHV